MGRRRRICDVAAEVLRETGNPAVMWGDTGLLDMIARRALVPTDKRYFLDHQDKILNALWRQPGPLVKGHTLLGNNRRVRIFRLPEQAEGA